MRRPMGWDGHAATRDVSTTPSVQIRADNRARAQGGSSKGFLALQRSRGGHISYIYVDLMLCVVLKAPDLIRGSITRPRRSARGSKELHDPRRNARMIMQREDTNSESGLGPQKTFK